MIVVAVIIGLLGGYGAIAFRYFIQFIQGLTWQTDEFGNEAIQSLGWYWILGIPAVGGIVVGLIIRYFASETRGSGVPEVMVSVARRQGVIRQRVVVAKVLAAGLSIGTGASVGREGPVAHIGAAIGSTIGQWLRMSPMQMRSLVGCGAAAGIAATFNAPIAGALFCVEIVLGEFGVTLFSPIVISAVTATIVSRQHLGDLPAFEIPTYEWVHPGEFAIYGILGIAAAVLALSLMKALFFFEDRFRSLRLPLPLQVGLGGALTGAVGLLFPGVLSVGHETVNQSLSLSEHPGVLLLLGLIVAKLIATGLSLGSGAAGGVVAPCLFLGATLGALIGTAAGQMYGDNVAPPGAYALVGMGAVLAAATHAPITAIITIFEMTGQYSTILPLMTACMVSTLVIAQMQPNSIYHATLLRRGIDIRMGKDISVLSDVAVTEVLCSDVTTIPLNAPLTKIFELTTESSFRQAIVVDELGRAQGVITEEILRPYLEELHDHGHDIHARDVVERRFTKVSGTETLDTVMPRLLAMHHTELPVVDDDDRLLGLVRLSDLLDRYRQELRRDQVHRAMDDEEPS